MGYTPLLALVILWTLYAVDIALVAGRIWLRKRHLRQNLQANDYLITASLLLALTHGSATTWMLAMKLLAARGVENVSGYPEALVMIALGMNKAEQYLKVAYGVVICYICAIYASKAAALAFYYTLYQRFSWKMKVTLHLVTAFTTCTFLANIFLNLLWCMPLRKNWSVVPAPKCPAAIGLPSLITGTTSNILTDLLLIFIPVTLFKSLMLVRREYVAIAFVVSLGSISIISAGIRFMLYWELLLSKNIATVSVDGMVLWTNVDIALALAAVCLPAFRVLLRGRERRVPVARRWSKRPPLRGLESSGDTCSDGESQVELRDISVGSEISAVSGMSAASNDEVVH